MNKQSKNSSEIVADILKNKLEKLKEKQQQIKNKLKDANELIRHKKETENQRITINEISEVSEIIKLANGQTIGFSLSNMVPFDAVMGINSFTNGKYLLVNLFFP